VGLAALEGGGVFVDAGLAANEWVFGGHGHADVDLLKAVRLGRANASAEPLRTGT
jgi:acyl-coenzyme A thioesterase PaaI-like protein